MSASASPRSRQMAQEAPPRRFEGKRFVALEPWFIDAMCEGCETLVEMCLILQGMKLANEQEPGSPGAWVAPLRPGRLAALAHCSPQNLDSESERLFGPTSIIVQMPASKAIADGIITSGVPVDARAVTLRIKTGENDVAKWVKLRRLAKQKKKDEAIRKAEEKRNRKAEQKQREEEQRKAAEAAAEHEATEEAAAAERRLEEERRQAEEAARRKAKPSDESSRARVDLLPCPVRVGPGAKPFELSAECRAAFRSCRAIGSRRPGELTHLSIDSAGFVLFDFVPAPGSGQLSTAVDNRQNELLKTNDLTVSTLAPGSPGEPSPSAGQDAAKKLRRTLDRRYMAKIGSPIDDRIFGNVLEALGEATERRTTIFLDLIEHPATKAKFRSWPFLVSIARTARAADEREQEVGSEEAPPSRWPAHETKAERSEREHRELEERRKTWPTG